MRLASPVGLVATFALLAASPAPAVHRRAWVTSVTGTGNLASWPEAGGQTGLAAGDAICRARATAGGHPNPGTYRAWLSDGATDAYCHVRGLTGKKANGCSGGTPDPAGPWYRFNGNTPMTAGLDRLTGPEREIYRAVLYDDLTHPVDDGAASRIWTATHDTGVWIPGGFDCAGWTSSAASDFASFGNSLETAQTWTYASSAACNQSLRLLCVEPGASDLPVVRWAVPGSLVFVTRAAGSGDLSSWPEAGGASGLVAGDAICRNVAATAHLPAPESFVAWLSDSATDARDRLTSDGPFRRIDGVTIANSKADLLDASNAASIHQFEDGSYLVSEEGGKAFTGTLADGTADPVDTCADWSSAASTEAGRRGLAAGTSNGYWTARSAHLCNWPLHLYCFSNATTLFWDGFDLTGDTSRWSSAVP